MNNSIQKGFYSHLLKLLVRGIQDYARSIEKPIRQEKLASACYIESSQFSRKINAKILVTREELTNVIAPQFEVFLNKEGFNLEGVIHHLKDNIHESHDSAIANKFNNKLQNVNTLTDLVKYVCDERTPKIGNRDHIMQRVSISILKEILLKKFEVTKYYEHVTAKPLGNHDEIRDLQSARKGLITQDNTIVLRFNIYKKPTPSYGTLILFGNRLKANETVGDLSYDESTQLKNDLVKIKNSAELDMIILIVPFVVKTDTIQDYLNNGIYIEEFGKEKIESYTHGFYFKAQPSLSYPDAVEINKFADLVTKKINEYLRIMFANWALKYRFIGNKTLSSCNDSLLNKSENSTEQPVRRAFKEKLWKYSSLYTRTISFEGELIKKLADEISNKQYGENAILNKSVEIKGAFFPYSLYLSKKVKKRFVFSASGKFKEHMEMVEFPNKSIFFELYNTDPSYIAKVINVSDKSHSKADLVISALGAGSYMGSSRDFLRHVTTLLNEDGGLYISFINKDSFVADMGFGQKMEFAMPPGSRILNGLKNKLTLFCRPYTVEEAVREVSRYFVNIECFTYPTVLPLVTNQTLKNRIDCEGLDKEISSKPVMSNLPKKAHITAIERVLSRKENNTAEGGAERGLGALICIKASTKKATQDIRKPIVDFLKSLGNQITYEEIRHNPTTNHADLTKALIDIGQPIHPNIVLKTIAIGRDEKNIKGKKVFLIRPAELRVDGKLRNAIRDRFELKKKSVFAQEKELAAVFNTGCISPLIGIAIRKYSLFEQGVEFIYDPSLLNVKSQYFYFSSGHNEYTIKIGKDDFFKIMDMLQIPPFDTEPSD